MSQLVECVMNFSEGRSQAVIDQIVESIASVPGVTLLDQARDSAHHRCVITFVGSPAAVEAAAVRATGKAAELIDLRRHRGEHPRLGATDVIPFVPIQDVTLKECVAMARRAGERIARQYAIPVYLYEEAATRPDRRNLADIRKGEFEQLRDEIATNDARIPDFGERKVHPTAGATVVGAREGLIAYNVYLDTEDVAVARKIAKAIRSSSGGLPFVKAMGFRIPARKQTQVSMNLINYRHIPMFRAFEAVSREAKRHGVRVVSSEIVGLVPESALLATAQYYLQIENFSEDLVLENRILAARRRSHTGKMIGDFVDEVARGEMPAGGGAVAALSVSLAAGLAEKVCHLSLAGRRDTSQASEIEALREQAGSFKQEAATLMDRDSQAWAQVQAAGTMEEGEARNGAIQQSLRAATEVPLQTAAIGHRVLQLLARLCELGSESTVSDAAASAAVAAAGVQSAGYLVADNLRGLVDTDFKEASRRRLKTLVEESLEIAEAIRGKVGRLRAD